MAKVVISGEDIPGLGKDGKITIEGVSLERVKEIIGIPKQK